MALGRTVEELDASLGSRELTYWQVYDSIYPFGVDRDNMHAGIIASVVAQVHGGKKNMADFMLLDEHAHKQHETKKFVAALRGLSKKKK